MDALNVLTHHAEKFGVLTVIDVTIFDLTTGGVILELDTLKMANINTEMEEKIITGGKANDELIIYNHSRTTSLDLQDAIASMSSLQYLWGTDLLDDGSVTEHIKTVVDGVTADTDLTDYITDFVAGTKATISDGTNTVVLTTVTDSDGSQNPITTVVPATGTELTIWYEKLNANAKSLTLSSDSFAPNVKIVGKTFFIDKATGDKKYAELVIHNYKLNPSFEMAFDAAGDASVFDFSGKCLVDEDGNSITLKYLGDNE